VALIQAMVAVMEERVEQEDILLVAQAAQAGTPVTEAMAA
jgi:hypothetical protein